MRRIAIETLNIAANAFVFFCQTPALAASGTSAWKMKKRFLGLMVPKPQMATPDCGPYLHVRWWKEKDRP